MKGISKCKIYWFPLLFTCLMACSKDSGSVTSGYYVKFKLDNEQKQYNEITAVFFSNNGYVYHFGGEAQKDPANDSDELIAVIVNDLQPITINKVYGDSLMDAMQQGLINYSDETGSHYTSMITDGDNVKIVFTEISDTTVSGTFSGKIYNVHEPLDIHSITEGQFHLARQ
ncbi:MAG TPA: hypothetical protein VEV83_07865 [Parafilimonas sp.]|nr:hypothetical protein [Parafilimonas sp.]